MTFEDKDWRRNPGTAQPMFEVFPIMRDLHELLWYLSHALGLQPAHQIHGELRSAMEDTERLTQGSPDVLRALDVAAHRRDVNAVLLRTSELVRAEVQNKKDHRGADLIGADLKGADLRGANLRGAYLIGADLRGADLGLADVTGADFRAADLRGADLTGTIFLIQSQLDSAKGNAATKLPLSHTLPTHWSHSANLYEDDEKWHRQANPTLLTERCSASRWCGGGGKSGGSGAPRSTRP